MMLVDKVDDDARASTLHYDYSAKFRSFRLIATLRNPCLGPVWDLVVGWSIRVLTMLLEILIIIVVSIGVIIAMLGSKLVHLLRARCVARAIVCITTRH